MATRPFPLRPALLFALALAATACDREPGEAAPTRDESAAPRANDDATASQPGAAVDATAVVERAPVAGADPGFDVRAFAGRFAAEGTALHLLADGSYTATVHAESADAALAHTGTWTVEDDGAALRLDPDSKAAPDRVYEIRTADTLVQAGGGQVLQRDDD